MDVLCHKAVSVTGGSYPVAGFGTFRRVVGIVSALKHFLGTHSSRHHELLADAQRPYASVCSCFVMQVKQLGFYPAETYHSTVATRNVFVMEGLGRQFQRA